MTFKSLINLANFGKPSYTPIERYHSDGGGYHHHGWRGYTIDVILSDFREKNFFFFVSHYLLLDFRSSSKGKGGGSGAALSALTLLAFLFLINVMQVIKRDTRARARARSRTGYCTISMLKWCMLRN